MNGSIKEVSMGVSWKYKIVASERYQMRASETKWDIREVQDDTKRYNISRSGK